MRQCHLRSRIAERPVAHVAIQQRAARAAGDQEVHIAAIVEVCGCDGDWPSADRRRQAGIGGDIGKAAVSVVAEELHGRACTGNVEIAVMIDVDQRGGRDLFRRARQLCRRGRILKAAVSSLMQQEISARAEHQEIGTRVVIDVACDDTCRGVQVDLIEV